MADHQPSWPLANHDDRALYRYLLSGRGTSPRHLFYATVRERIAQYEAGQGRKWKLIEGDFIAGFVSFWTALEAGTFTLETNEPPWFTFLSFYQLQTNRPFASPSSGPLHYRYCARDVLLKALETDKGGVTDSLVESYQPSSRRLLFSVYQEETNDVSFDDVYQEAFISLLRKPPAPDGKHTAQLFTIFRQIILRRAADAYRKKQKPPPDTLKPEDDGNNSEGFTDHIISSYGLDQQFGTDEPAEIISIGMAQLDEKCRDLLKLRFYGGKRYREVAALLGYSTDSVGQRIKRCLRKLRGNLFGS